MLSAYTEKHWGTLCRLLDREDLLTDPRFASNPLRVENRPALLSILGNVLSSLSSEKCVSWLSSNGIVVGAVRGYQQVLEAEDVEASGIFRSDALKREGGRYVGLPYRIEGQQRSVSDPCPELGEHSLAVMREAGLTATQIDSLIKSGIVATSEAVPEEASA